MGSEGIMEGVQKNVYNNISNEKDSKCRSILQAKSEMKSCLFLPIQIHSNISNLDHINLIIGLVRIIT
jgi:hypothetical protein